MSNEIIKSVVEQHNREATDAVVQAGVHLARKIKGEEARIEGCRERITRAQEGLKKVSGDVINEASVFGGSVPSGANHDTIVAVIEKANKDRQFEIEQRATQFTNSIVAEQNAITIIQGNIAELQKQANQLAPVTITPEQVSGQ